MFLYFIYSICEGNAMPVTGLGGPSGCATSRLPQFVDSRLRDGAEVSLTRRSAGRPLLTRKIPGTHFC
jgi:hypothetical protein